MIRKNYETCSVCGKIFKTRKRHHLQCSKECEEQSKLDFCYVCGKPVDKYKLIHRQCVDKINFKVQDEFIQEN